MDEQEINEFLEKFCTNSNSEQEHQQFLNWLKVATDDQLKIALDRYEQLLNLHKENYGDVLPNLIGKIEGRLDAEDFKTTGPRGILVRAFFLSYTRLAGVAAVVLLTICAAFFMTRRSGVQIAASKEKSTIAEKKIEPVSEKKATLILPNGDKIILDKARSGLLTDRFGATVVKSHDGQIIFGGAASRQKIEARSSAGNYNTVTTPRRGQYEVVLPDGSKVWLNAASTLRFPTSFTDTARIVLLSGEASFEVAKQRSRLNPTARVPFKVISGKHTIEVLGTHFNLKAYPDEASIKTTLLEGSVKVSQFGNSRILKPGQQAKAAETIQVKNVDPFEYIRWKDGYLNFSHEDIQSIMKNISRWYDVDVVYQKNLSKEEFVGNISRYEDVTKVLRLLELTGAVHFKIEGRRIIVMP